MGSGVSVYWIHMFLLSFLLWRPVAIGVIGINEGTIVTTECQNSDFYIDSGRVVEPLVGSRPKVRRVL